ncbi:LOW QUALITY PROTEIN: hypothetical protein V2J09_000148 [Rumex salicifolius]
MGTIVGLSMVLSSIMVVTSLGFRTSIGRLHLPPPSLLGFSSWCWSSKLLPSVRVSFSTTTLVLFICLPTLCFISSPSTSIFITTLSGNRLFKRSLIIRHVRALEQMADIFANTVGDSHFLSQRISSQQNHQFVRQEDNMGATSLSSDLAFHSRIKHIALSYHFVREQNGKPRVDYVSTDDQVADVLTKPLLRPRFQSIISKFGLSWWSSDLRGHDNDTYDSLLFSAHLYVYKLFSMNKLCTTFYHSLYTCLSSCFITILTNSMTFKIHIHSLTWASISFIDTIYHIHFAHHNIDFSSLRKCWTDHGHTP